MSEQTVQDAIDFNEVLLDMDGDPIKQRNEDGEPSDLTLGDACVRSLLVTLQNDKADGTQKLKRFNLARKIKGKGTDDEYASVRLNSKEKKMILDQAEEAYTTLIYARVYEALEGTTTDDTEE